MILSNINFNVLYVDPTISTAGNGATPATALKSLPVASSGIADATCYIIRRTAASAQVQLPQGENSSLASLAIVGMPKSTDELYTLMPAEAKAAWGADTADYANVLSVTSSEPYGGSPQGLVLPNCLTFFLHRVNLYRSAQSAFEACIQLTSEAQAGSVSIERCRFGLKGFDLDKSTQTAAPSHGSAMYIQANKHQVFSFRHCVLMTVPDGGYYYEAASWGVNVQSALFVDMSDVDVWCSTAQYGGDMGPGATDPAIKLGYYSSYSSSYSQICANCNLEGIRGHYVLNGTCGYLPPVLYVYSNEFTSLRHMSIGMEARTLGSGTPSVVSPCGAMVTCDGGAEYIYEHLAVTLPKVWKLPSGSNILKLCGSAASSLPGCAKKVEDIAVTLGTNAGVDTGGGGNYYSSYKSTDTSTWYANAALYLNIGSGYDGPGGGGGGKEPVIARDIAVTHPRGIALYVANCYLKSTVLQGMLRVYNATCDVASLSTWYPGHAIAATGGSTVRVGTLTLGKGNIAGSDSDPAILGNPQESTSFIFVGSSNGALMSDTRSTSTSHDNCYAVACANEQDLGHYTLRTVNGLCTTWGVARSGSAVTASLKVSNNTADGPGFISLGRQPFGGFAIGAEAGMKTLKIRIATKGLSETAQLARRVLVQASVPQEDGSCEMVFSNTRGRWSLDDSQWIGESGLSGHLLEMPLCIPGDCDVDVKIHIRWFSASGYLYIDPDIVIE